MAHNCGMSVRTTVDIPDDLYETLRQRAASENTSIRSLVIAALETRYRKRRTGIRLRKPPLQGRGKPGPLCPDRENPYDLIFT